MARYLKCLPLWELVNMSKVSFLRDTFRAFNLPTLVLSEEPRILVDGEATAHPLHYTLALHPTAYPTLATKTAGKGRLGISWRNTGAISLWNSSSVARCCAGVSPAPSAFRCSTSCPNCLWYRCTLSIICCGLPTKAELRSMASSREWNTGAIPRERIAAWRASKIGRYVAMASCDVLAP